MQLKLSLRWAVLLTFATVVLVLVVGYSMLSADYFRRGMDNIVSLNMESTVKVYLARVPPAERTQVATVYGLQITPGWELLPEALRQQLGQPPKRHEQLLTVFGEQLDDQQRPSLTFVFPYQIENNWIYATYAVDPDKVSDLVARNTNASLIKLAVIGIASATLLSLVVWLILLWVSRPVMRLGNWTRQLNPQTLRQPVPSFGFPELNELALLIRDSLSSVQQSLEREHSFLRHTSHELRTPITTIRNSVELMRKLEQNPELAQAQYPQVIDRLDRASLNMKYLTETLLWLSRDNVERLPETPVDLAQLLQQLVSEMNYLLQTKPVTVVLTTEPGQYRLPAVAARIVLGNLVRNAFQHCWEGEITILQQGPVVAISNPIYAESDIGEQGFGLGLQLTQQLCQRLHWPLSLSAEREHYQARVAFPVSQAG
ncbi:HAMP domain-containing sensor histidine kinase [Halioxenophilus sp. WMMB6]|uniref:sensor histidine kinase n=1 Tax=Halioxenophilus sp. WMMB6 TaxID=3073815 RepID=UPI00295F01CE|nr:HAMP domain-containing sensor histidine kinase [Halioxenophilus sp. WMMB6]